MDMPRIVRISVRVGLAAAAVTGLVASGMGAAEAVPVRPTATTSGTVLRVAITDDALYLDGPTTFPAGRVSLSLENARSKHDASVEVFRLASGYHWKDLRSDVKIFGENLFGPHGNKKKGLKALNHAIDHITAYGGFVTRKGKSAHGTLLLPQTGTYALFDDSGNLPKRPHWLTVTSPVGPQTLPTAGGNVVAKTNRRFAGDRVLPANGTINFTNESTESPHFLELAHVKEGTTRKQIINSFQSNGRPDFVLPGLFDIDALTLAQSMNFHVNLPAGEYAQMCFFPDPKTGMPHALMGMVRIVHLK
jgi:hypothetical protein